MSPATAGIPMQSAEKITGSLYAIDRQTGEKRTLKSNTGSGTSIAIASHTDAPYAHSVATHYKLSGFNITALKEYDRPLLKRVVMFLIQKQIKMCRRYLG